MDYHPEQAFNLISKDYINIRSTQYDNTDQLDILTKKLQPLQGKRVLELGCGDGNPVLTHFSKHGAEVWGVDISSEMIKAATLNLPNGYLLHQDMSKISLENNSFDAIFSFYAIFLIDVNTQFLLFQKIFNALKPGGIAYFTLLSEAITKTKEYSGMMEYLGQQFYFAHTSLEKYSEQLKSIGFTNLEIQDRNIGAENCSWVYCEKSR